MPFYRLIFYRLICCSSQIFSFSVHAEKNNVILTALFLVYKSIVSCRDYLSAVHTFAATLITNANKTYYCLNNGAILPSIFTEL